MTFWGARAGAVLIATGFVLSGCSTSQGNASAFDDPALGSNLRLLPGKSTTSGALIYATGVCGGACILTYPGGGMVGAVSISGSVQGALRARNAQQALSSQAANKCA